MENKPEPLKTYKNRYGITKKQSGTIKTNLELYRVVMGCSGGYRLPGGSDDFLLQTHTSSNIYIITAITIITIITMYPRSTDLEKVLIFCDSHGAPTDLIGENNDTHFINNITIIL